MKSKIITILVIVFSTIFISYSYSNIKLKKFKLSKDMTIQKYPCQAGWVGFYENGKLKKFKLSKDMIIQKYPCQAGWIGFHKNGKIESCNLSKDFTIQGYPCEKERIDFDESGKLLAFTLSKDYKINNKLISKNSKIIIDIDGKAIAISDKYDDNMDIETFSKILKYCSKRSLEIDQTKLDVIKTKFVEMFPKTEGDLKEYTWDISISKAKDDNCLFISADLYRNKGEEYERIMWFHIIYNPNLTEYEREKYGDDFEGYKGSLNEDNHLWILVNNVEIRAIAESDDFMKTQKIKDVLKSFDLKSLEKYKI